MVKIINKNLFSILMLVCCCLGYQTTYAQDACADATLLTLGTCPDDAAGFSTAGLANDGPGCTGGAPGADIWFEVVVPATGNVDVFVTSEAGVDHDVRVLEACGDLVTLACGGAVGQTENLALTDLDPGASIFIQVYDWDNTTNGGAFDICVEEPPFIAPPANDLCAGATVVPLVTFANCGAGIPTDNSGATDSGVDEASCYTGYEGADVWYQITVPAGQTAIRIGSAGPGAYSTILVGVYSGACGGLTEVGCDQLFGFGTADPDVFDNHGSTDITGLTSGETYFVRISDGFGGNDFGVQPVCISLPPPPPANDECAAAFPLTFDLTAMGTNLGATPSAEGPVPGCAGFTTLPEDNDVWFSVTVPVQPGTLTIETFNNGGITDSGLAIYSGTCDALTLIECDDDGGAGLFSSIDASDLTPGEVILIRVWEFGSDAEGTFAIEASFECDNDTPITTAPLIDGATSICQGETAIYTIANLADLEGEPLAYTYLWSNGATTPTLSATVSGTYSVVVSDACGNGPSPMSNEITLNVIPPVFETQLNCKEINVPLDQNCQVVLDANDMLSTPVACPGIYDVDVNGTGAAIVTEDMIGTVPVEVSVPGSDPLIFCWANILVEDKNTPTITCPDPSVIACGGDVTPGAPYGTGDAAVPTVTNACSNFTVTYEDDSVNGTCDNDAITVITRTWTVTNDNNGNTATCEQVISLERKDVSDVDFPADSFTGECGDGTSPAETGQPDIDGTPVGEDGVCGVICTFVDGDNLATTCDGNQDFFRTWTCYDWCGGFETSVQLIKLADNAAPTITLAADAAVSTDFDACSATVTIPAAAVAVADACASVNTPTGEVIAGGGTLIALPSGGWVLEGATLGTNTVRFTATDDCGNADTADWNVEVTDEVSPAAICEIHHVVNLQNIDPNEPTLVFANTFDDGSYDACGSIEMEVRRMNPSCINFDWTTAGPGLDSDPNALIDFRDRGASGWFPAVPFACCDLDATEPVMVEFRVTDAEGNSNTCMVEIEVKDKVDPILPCPTASKQVECHEELPPITDDLFATQEPGTSPAYFIGNQQFNNDNNYTTETFLGYYPVVDNCSNAVYIREVGGVNQCKTGNFLRQFRAADQSDNLSNTCNQSIAVVNSAPFSGPSFPGPATRNCTSAADSTDPSSTGEPNISSEDACDQVGFTYNDIDLPISGSACRIILRTWTVIDACQYNAATGAGLWTGEQVITVNDLIDPEFTGTTCDNGPTVSANSNTCNASVPLMGEATDVCQDSSELLTWSYVVDLNGDGVDTDGFGIDQRVFSGNNATKNYPIGTHTITWTVEDNCGNWVSCEKDFYVVDNSAPYIDVITSTTVNLSAQAGGGGVGVLWIAPLDLGTTDDCSNPVEIRVQNPSLGLDQTAPPASATTAASIEFDCDDMPFVNIDYWARDNAGNWGYVIIQVVVQDPNGLACAQQAQIAGNISTEDNEMVENVTVDVMGPNAEIMESIVTTDNGNYGFNVQNAGNYNIEAERNETDPVEVLNGVSTYDLVLISMHILGIELLDSPYKMIAADVNNSGNITSYDMVDLRKVILFIAPTFPDNTNWRFVDQDFVFPDASNPWATTFPEELNYNDVVGTMEGGLVGIKVGDVNNSALANSAQLGDTRTTGELSFNINDVDMEAGEEYTVDFLAKDFANILGYQFTLNLDSNVEFVDFEAGELNGLTADNFGFSKLNEGVITTSWNSRSGETLADDAVVFSVTVKATADTKLSNAINVSSRYTAAEAYNSDADLLDVELEFNAGVTASEFALYQNQPNPFKGQTVIGFTLDAQMPATLTIYDVAGRVLKSIEGEYAQGYNTVTIDRSELNGAGVLYYQLDTQNDSATKKMIIID